MANEAPRRGKKYPPSEKKFYGYIRVSSKDQNEARQRVAMREMGIPASHLFIDKQSGKTFNRPAYQDMIQVLEPNDVLFIKSIDRLGRNYEEILTQWKYLIKNLKIDIVVMDMPILDTRRGKDLLGTLISDIVLQVLSFVAENENVNIHQRQAEGIAAAKARGVKFGRPAKPLPENFDIVYDDWKAGMMSTRSAAKMCGMPLSTFRYHVDKRSSD